MRVCVFDDIHSGQQDQVLGGFAAARRDHHTVSGKSEPRDHVTSNKATASDHDNTMHVQGAAVAVGPGPPEPRGVTTPRRAVSGSWLVWNDCP